MEEVVTIYIGLLMYYIHPCKLPAPVFVKATLLKVKQEQSEYIGGACRVAPRWLLNGTQEL